MELFGIRATSNAVSINEDSRHLNTQRHNVTKGVMSISIYTVKTEFIVLEMTKPEVILV